MQKFKEAGIALLSGAVGCNLYILLSQWLFKIDLTRNYHGWVEEVPTSYQYYASVIHFGASDLFIVLAAAVLTGLVLGLVVPRNPFLNSALASFCFCVFLVLSSSWGVAAFLVGLGRLIVWCVLVTGAATVAIRLRSRVTPSPAT